MAADAPVGAELLAGHGAVFDTSSRPGLTDRKRLLLAYERGRDFSGS
jgi:hypothetical protein